MNKLIGRKAETKILELAYNSNKAEMVAVVGRRRVGKTFLIKKTYHKRISFELTGLQHATKSEQLSNFFIAFRQFFPDHLLEDTTLPTSWLDAFFLLSQALERQPIQQKQIIFLDELPWLAGKKSAFLKGLSWFWNSWAVNQPVVVVICGSAASWMIEKVINDRGGLHNRVTRLLPIAPFTLLESEDFLKSKGIRLSRYHIATLYMVMGGIPMYLDQVLQGKSAIENIQAICFDKNGYLRNEFYRLFSSLFDQSDAYVELIRVLAAKRGGLTRKEIVAKSNQTNGGQLSRRLEELQQSGFIGIYNNFGKKSRGSIYRLTDPYSLFYLTFLENLGPNAQVDFRKLSDLPKYRSWSGYAYENIVLLHAEAVKISLGITGIYTTLSSFLAKGKQEQPGAQIDLLIDRGDHSINLCEIKFSQSPLTLTKSMITNLLQKRDVFQSVVKTNKHIFLTLITTFGLQNEGSRYEVDQVIQLDDLFA